MNTHYALLVFSGAPACEHYDEELRGQPPSARLIACGPEEFCRDALGRWTDQHPLPEWETEEVVQRDLESVLHGSALTAAAAGRRLLCSSSVGSDW